MNDIQSQPSNLIPKNHQIGAQKNAQNASQKEGLIAPNTMRQSKSKPPFVPNCNRSVQMQEGMRNVFSSLKDVASEDG